ncbi:MAG: YggS family pyridoxal phosphate-dependent enzyme [Anaerolineaceae bacterium]|nr:YggS family pyridoxal phosphate-dependent enzyme [Anaerolineaceae bacterium]
MNTDLEIYAIGIKNNLEIIHERIEKATLFSGRKSSDVQLITVSKKHALEVVQAAVIAGVKHFGENYPEEAVTKIKTIREDHADIKWHMIGHLQSRKAKLVVDNFHYMHSLDSVRLAKKMNRILIEKKKKLPILLEINVSGEESKSGWKAWERRSWDDLAADMEVLLTLPQIRILGLMTMPPLFGDPEKSRPYFRKLRELKEYLSNRFPDGKWQELSMGTSADFEIAIQEGATFIRVGQAILGPRPTKR